MRPILKISIPALNNPQIKFLSTFAKAKLPEGLLQNFNKVSHSLAEGWKSSKKAPSEEEIIRISKQLITSLKDAIGQNCKDSQSFSEAIGGLRSSKYDGIFLEGIPVKNEYEITLLITSIVSIAGYKNDHQKQKNSDPFLNLYQKVDLIPHTDLSGAIFQPDLISLAGLRVESDKTKTYIMDVAEIYNILTPESQEILQQEIFYDAKDKTRECFKIFHQDPKGRLCISYNPLKNRIKDSLKLDDAEKVKDAVVELDGVIEDFYKQKKFNSFTIKTGSTLIMRNDLHGRFGSQQDNSERSLVVNLFSYDENLLTKLDDPSALISEANASNVNEHYSEPSYAK